MIGKSRQSAPQSTRYDASVGPPRGILQTTIASGTFTHSRQSPAPELSPWILHYWMVAWDLRPDEAPVVETLPHPNVQLVFSTEDAHARVHGIHTKRFIRPLHGRAQVFGVKFRAGGFFPFFRAPVSALRSKTVPAAPIFGPEIDHLIPALAGPAGEPQRIHLANDFFRCRMPAPDAEAATAANLVELVLKNPEVRRVADLSARSGLSDRSLQRLFQRYVGVSPKWVICRYRLHELVEHLHRGESIDWAGLAAELGYFDQSHLIRDFRSLTGRSPERYRLSLADS